MLRPFVLALLVASSAEAAARDFTFSWDSKVLEPGKAQGWFQLTPRTGRRVYYARFDSDAGATIGVAKGLETYLGLDTSFDFTGQPPQESASGHITNLWRYRLFGNSEGLSMLAQLKLSGSFDDLVFGGRVVVDYRPNAVRLAFNAALERTVLFQDVKEAVKTRAEQTLALGYSLKNTLTPGLELVVQESMTDYKFAGTAFFMGGSLSCERKWGWFALGMAVQVAAVKPDADVGDHEGLELRDHERFWFRFAIGVNAL